MLTFQTREDAFTWINQNVVDGTLVTVLVGGKPLVTNNPLKRTAYQAHQELEKHLFGESQA